MGTWMNGDGLFVKLGTSEGTVGNAGEYTTLGPLRHIEVTIPALTALTTTPAILDDNTWLPKNARIERVDLVTVTAATSAGSATLDIGLQKEDRSTQLDYDGLVAALAKTAYDAAGETNQINVGSTGAGALIGTSLTDTKGYITANYTTAAFTAGKLVVRIYYSIVT